MKRKIYIISTIIWMITIFCFSARNGVTSTGDSHYIGMKIGEVFVPGFDQWNSTRQLAFAQKVDFPIRKSAHAMEYALLGFLITGSFITNAKERKKQGNKVQEHKKLYLAAWIGSAFYAMTDEFHQLFVPGRSGRVADVLLDSTGAAVGVCLFLIIQMWIQHKTHSKSTANCIN